MTCGIYKLTSPSGKIYIGQSINIKDRLKEHKGDAKKCFSGKMGKVITKLRASFQKYEWSQFNKEIIEICSPEQLNEKEIYHISLYDSFERGLNSTTGGNSKFYRSIETKQKLRNLQLGKYGGNQAMAFYIDDVRYLSILDAATKLKIPMKTIHNRLNSVNQKYSNYIYEDVSCIPNRKILVSGRSIKISINNIVYDSVSEASLTLNIGVTTLLRRARSVSKKFNSYKLVS